MSDKVKVEMPLPTPYDVAIEWLQATVLSNEESETMPQSLAALIRREREKAFDAGARAVDEHVEGCEVDPLEWKGEGYLAARRAAIEGGGER